MANQQYDHLKTEQMSLNRLAANLGISDEDAKHALALVGWNIVYERASRDASIREWDERVNANESGRSATQVHDKKWAEKDAAGLLGTPNEKEFFASASDLLLPLVPKRIRAKKKVRGEPEPGFVYVLFDGVSMKCKIGCTASDDGARQKSIMSAHGSVLVNALNAGVKDRFLAEKQCHKHFSERRENGEWFLVDLHEVIEYIHAEVDWISLDFECQARVLQYILAAKRGDQEGMRIALTRKESSKRAAPRVASQSFDGLLSGNSI